MDDLWGLEAQESDWFSADALPATLKTILGEVGHFYAPLLIANAEAVQAGAEQLETTIDGQPWVQQPFPYQAKRLMWLGGGVRRPSRCGACLGGCGARRRRL